jgi:dephospho-CoA kinase
MVIGVTGPYAAGKDEVSRLLAARGFSEINVDALGHRVLEEKKIEAVRLFGNGILRPDGSVDRRALGRIVFQRPEELARLEALLHPRMRELISAAVRAAAGRDYVINAAILIPLGLAPLTDLILVVRASLFTRFCRARGRDGLTWRAFLNRNRSQREIVPKPRPENVDIKVIWNTRNRMYLKTQIDAILRRCAPDVKAAEREKTP